MLRPRFFARALLVCALTLAVLPAGAGSSPSRPASGFSSSSTRVYSAPAASASSWRSSPAATAPSGVTDRAVSRQISGRALTRQSQSDFPAASAAPSPGNNHTLGSAPGGYRAPGPAPYAAPAYAAPASPDNSFLNGLLTGVITSHAARSGDADAHAAPARTAGAPIDCRWSPPDDRGSASTDKTPDANNCGWMGPTMADATPPARAFPDKSTEQASGSALVAGGVLLIVVGAAVVIAMRKRNTVAAGHQAAKQDDAAPASVFRPGGRIVINSTPFVLAMAAGGDIADLSEPYTIAETGRLKLGGVDVERAYFKDGEAFLERAGDRQMRVYHRAYEEEPSSAAEWETFLGPYGLIGAANVIVPPNGRSYDRVWGSGDKQVKPVEVVEHGRDLSGKDLPAKTCRHQIMQYARPLGETDKALTEYLYLDAQSDENGASLIAWVGIDVLPDDVDIA